MEQTRYGPNEKKKGSRRGGKWRLLSKKGIRFVLPAEIDEGGSKAATMTGYAWTARGKAPVVGSRAEPQAETVRCFDRCRRKETRARGGRPNPGGEIGKVGMGWVHSIRYRTPTLPFKDNQSSSFFVHVHCDDLDFCLPSPHNIIITSLFLAYMNRNGENSCILFPRELNIEY